MQTRNKLVRTSNLLIFILFIILSIQIFNISVYSQEVIINSNNSTIPQQIEEQQDILTILSNSSITNILISTFTIPIIGLLIAKLQGLRKKLEMIEILTKVMVKMKNQMAEREKEFEEYKKLNEEKMDEKNEEIEEKIKELEDKVTNTLIDYLSNKSNMRGRMYNNKRKD